jgi:CheY-like chemotaxis protein
MATILLVDDQLLFRENLAEALEDHGYAVVRAADADEALKSVDSYLIDLFVLDVALPGSSGLELLKAFQAKPALRRIPAIFLTAYPRQEVMEEANRMGIGDFLVKSDISLRDLLERIEHGLLAAQDHTTGLSGPPSSRADPFPSRRHLRPALRRWRPQPARPQCKDLFAMASEEPENMRILSLLTLDPEASRWMRRILSKGCGEGVFLEELLEARSPRTNMRLLLLRAVVEGAMRSMEPFSDLRRLWKRSLTIALLAEELSPITAFASPLEAFLAGMCAEVPWVFAIQALETEYPDVKAEAWEEGHPIRQHLAGAFGTDPAALALETVKGLEVSDPVWKAVVDLLGKRGGSQIWEPGAGGRVLDIVSELAHLTEIAWHPCLTVRALLRDETKWLRKPEDLPGILEGMQAKIQEIMELGALPEAFGTSETRSAPVSDADRRFLLLRSPEYFVPDPFEAVLRRFGAVELVAGVEGFQGDETAVRVALAEPGTETWKRVVESTRRVVVFHVGKLPRRTKLGPHAHLEFPVTLTAMEEALRPRS